MYAHISTRRRREKLAEYLKQGRATMASLYQRTLRSGSTSPVWWVKYSAGDRVIRQSTGTTDKRTAQRSS